MVLQGEKLERPTYSVIQTITEGNTSVCYRAYHEIFGTDVVQKTISLLGFDDALAYSEPRLLKELRHKHLVEVWEAQWDPDPQWSDVKAVTFVMPYYQGRSVADALIDGRRFSIGEAVGIACGVLDALHYLHVERQLLHRDVKPGNVFLDTTGRFPRLGDLGSAASMTSSGDADVRGGTPLYRPPESWIGRYTVQGDLYGVGFTMLECLNGPLPYHELNFDQIDARLRKGQRAIPARMLKPGPHVPLRLARLVAKLLDPDPLRRPPTALAVQRALQGVRHLDWYEHIDGDDRVWDGHWPPGAGPGKGRCFEIRAAPISRGRYSGEQKLSAHWRPADTAAWRQFRSLGRRTGIGDDRALAEFFRDIERAVDQNAAAR